MSKIINLRTARKQRNRAARKREADANAAQHGRSAADRQLSDARNAQHQRKLDGHRRDADAPQPPNKDNSEQPES